MLRPPAANRVACRRFCNLPKFGALQLLRCKAVELLKAHDQRPPSVGINAVGLAVHHDFRMRVHAGDANLDRRKTAAPDFVFLRHLVDMRDLCLDLHRALRGARRSHRLTR